MAIVYGPYGASRYYLVHTPEVWTNEENRKDFDRISSVLNQRQTFQWIRRYWESFSVIYIVLDISYLVIIFAAMIISTALEAHWIDEVIGAAPVLWTFLVLTIISLITAIWITMEDKKKFEKDKITSITWIKNLCASGKAHPLIQKGLERIERLKSIQVVADGLSAAELEEWRSDIAKIYSFDALDKKAVSIREIQAKLEKFSN